MALRNGLLDDHLVRSLFQIFPVVSLLPVDRSESASQVTWRAYDSRDQNLVMIDNDSFKIILCELRDVRNLETKS